MIIVEERFEEMFSVLPKMKRKSDPAEALGFSIQFGFGDDKELNSFLQRQGGRPYPLIWLLYPFKERHLEKRVELRDVTLILAVETTADKTNAERFNDTFKPILFPLYNNILWLFEKSNIIKVHNYYDVIKYPNYGELNVLRTKEESKTTDIWDALKLNFNCEINNACFRNLITFK